jgi:hypothetical protein
MGENVEDDCGLGKTAEGVVTIGKMKRKSRLATNQWFLATLFTVSPLVSALCNLDDDAAFLVLSSIDDLFFGFFEILCGLLSSKWVGICTRMTVHR